METNGINDINGIVLHEQSNGLVYLVLKLRRTGWEAAVRDGKAKGWQKDAKAKSIHLRGGTRKVGKQERNRRKNEGERGGKNT